MKLRLEGKDIFFTTEISLQAFAWVGKLVDAKILHGAEDLDSPIQNLEWNWDKEKRVQYKREQAKLLSTISDHLPEDDQIIIDEFGTAVEVWSRLKMKYENMSVIAANLYLSKIHNFEFNELDGIDEVWARLKEFRRKLVAVNSNMRHTYPDDGLLMVLMIKLPDSYQTIVDELYLQDHLSVEEKIQRLLENEERSKGRSNLVSRRRPAIMPRPRHSDASMKDVSDRSISPSKMCNLCKGENFQRDCPFVVEIQKFGEKLQKKHEKRDAGKSSKPVKFSQPDSRKSNATMKPRAKKSLGYSARNNETEHYSENSDSDVSDDSLEQHDF